MLLSSIIPQLKNVPYVEDVKAQDDYTIIIIPKKYPLGYKEEKCQEPCLARFVLTHNVANHGEIRLKIEGAKDDPFGVGSFFDRLIGYTTPQIFFKWINGEQTDIQFQVFKTLEINGNRNSEFMNKYTANIEQLYSASFMITPAFMK